MARLSEFLHQLIVEPIKNRSFALFLLKTTQILHDRTGGACDALLRRVTARLKPPVALPPSRFLSDSEIAESARMLREHGWSMLPKRLSTTDIAELRTFALATPAYTEQCTNRMPVDPTLPVQPHARFQWLMNDLIRVPAIKRLMEDSALHRIAQDYLHCRPILTSVSAWMDGVFHGTYDAHVYHYDNDGPGFLKFFVYLTDVDSATGAHTFIQDTHGRRKPHQFRAGMRYETDDIVKHFGRKNEITFAAPAGTIIAEDTAGFHRGMDPTKGFRLLVQLQYSIIDIPHIEEFEIGIRKVELEGLDPSIARITRKLVKA